MDNEARKKIEQSAKMLTTILHGTALLLMLFGAFCLTNVPMVKNFIGVDEQAVKIISWTLIAMGVMDLIAARFVGKKSRDGDVL